VPSVAEAKKRGGVVRTRTKVIGGQRYIVVVYRKKGKRGGRTTMHKAKG
jgi:hypothetical protein